jgi:hypothetical protein
MRLTHRVEKRTAKSTSGRRRGRPQQCSESWKKKLILLSMCGLNTATVVRVLKIQSEGSVGAEYVKARKTTPWSLRR